MHIIRKLNIKRLLLVLCMALYLAGLAQFVQPVQVAAADGPICVLLDQGERACPTAEESTDSKTQFPSDTKACYYFDPGNPFAGTVKNFPGWQKTGCGADIFKEGLCVTGKVPQNPKCQRIGVKPDQALDCPKENCDLNQKYIEPLINVLAALVGIVVTASIIFGGIQYASSADDPQKVSQAKGRITKSLMALVAFFFLYMFLQWLVPGGFL
jgi:hypothetical protein